MGTGDQKFKDLPQKLHITSQPFLWGKEVHGLKEILQVQFFVSFSNLFRGSQFSGMPYLPSSSCSFAHQQKHYYSWLGKASHSSGVIQAHFRCHSKVKVK